MQIGVSCISPGEAHIHFFIQFQNAMKIINLTLTRILETAVAQFKKLCGG